MVFQRGDQLQVGNTVLELGRDRCGCAAGAATDVGRVRSINQDSFLVLADRGLFAWPTAWAATRAARSPRQLAVDALRADLRRRLRATPSPRPSPTPTQRIHDTRRGRPRPAGHGHHAVAAAVVPRRRQRPTRHRARCWSPTSATAAPTSSATATSPSSPRTTAWWPTWSARARSPRRRPRSTRSATSSPGPSASTTRSTSTCGRSTPVRRRPLLLCSDGLFNEVGRRPDRRRAAPPGRPAGGGRRAGAPGQRGRRPRQHHRASCVDVVDDGGVAEAASAALAGAPGSARLRRGPTWPASRTARDERRTPRPPVGRAAEPCRRRGARAPGPRRRAPRSPGASLVLRAARRRRDRRRRRHDPWYGTSTYFVGFRRRRGRRSTRAGPVACSGSTPSSRSDTGIERADVPERYLPTRCDDGQRAGARCAEAERYVSQHRAGHRADRPPPRRTTTTLPVPTTARRPRH